jgi:hypothetical protein
MAHGHARGTRAETSVLLGALRRDCNARRGRSLLVHARRDVCLCRLGPGNRLPGAVGGSALARWSGSIAVPALAIVIGGLAVRRKAAGFSRLDLRRPELIGVARTIQRRFRWVSVVQFAGCALSAWLGTRFHREDLIWPGIALVVSLHFAPLGDMFRMRPYVVAAAAGSVISAAAPLIPAPLLDPASRFVFIGIGMGGVMWITAVYAILHADRFAEAWSTGS